MHQFEANYWDEVNHFYGEILTGLEPNTKSLGRMGDFFVTRARYTFSWAGQEQDTNVTAERSLYGLLGGLIRRGVDCLMVETPLPEEPGMSLRHEIYFNPDRGLLIEVGDFLIDSNASGDSRRPLREDIEAIRNNRRRRKASLTIPIAADYKTLKQELQRGAAFRKFEL